MSFSLNTPDRTNEATFKKTKWNLYGGREYKCFGLGFRSWWMNSIYDGPIFEMQVTFLFWKINFWLKK